MSENERRAADDTTAAGGTSGESIYERVVGSASLESAVLFGFVTAILVYAAVGGLAMADPGFGDDDGNETQLEEEPSGVEAYGWLAFSAHFVDTKAQLTLGTGQQISQSIDLISQEQPEVPAPVYRLIPALLLILSGALFTRRSINSDVSPVEGFKTGALVTAGYLPAVFAGTLMFVHRTQYQSGYVSYSVPTGSAVLLAGLAFPIVFGGIGGYLLFRN
jgi:hypothetical protein